MANNFRSVNQNLYKILAQKENVPLPEIDEDEISDDEYIASLEAYNMDPIEVQENDIDQIDNFFDYVIALPVSKVTAA